MNRLQAMFAAVGVLLVGGVSTTLYLLRPEYAVGDAIDAGLLPLTVPARLSCRARVKDSCRAALGNPPRYLRLGLKARKSRPAVDPPFIAFDVPTAWQDCLVAVGTPAEACDVVEDGACTDATICAAGASPQAEVNACACSSGANCTVGGQPAVVGVTLAAGTWTGAGCVRKYCGPEIAGEQGQSWPAGCP